MLFHENEFIEFKEAYVEDIRKEIIAFANSGGGTLYVGVKDNGEVVGIAEPDIVSLQISNSCRDAIKPDITMFLAYDILDIDEKKVIQVQVQRGTSRPYYLASKGLKPSGVFVRQGASSVPASDAAIRQMIKETDGDKFEDMRSLNQELTFEQAKKSFELCGVEFHKAQMKTLGLINSENIFTNLALLLSDQCPHIIKAATFCGVDKEEFQDRKEFTGSLLKQLNDVYDYLNMRNKTKATFEGLYRIDSRDYSETALREALMNAIVHRDYSFSASTLVSVYDNRVEIISYGGLAGDVTLEDVLFGISVCRNQKLANVFYRLKLIEAYGTGLNKIRNAYKNKKGKPEFMTGFNTFKVILPNMSMMEDIGSITCEHDGETEKVINYIKEHYEVTRKDVENYMQISTSAAIRLMKRLKDRELVKAVGKGKNVKYIIKE